RSCDQSCTFPIGSYKLSQGCEPSSEERSAGNLHATFCGNRGRATASGDPVGGIARCPPIPDHRPEAVIQRQRLAHITQSKRSAKPLSQVVPRSLSESLDHRPCRVDI